MLMFCFGNIKNKPGEKCGLRMHKQKDSAQLVQTLEVLRNYGRINYNLWRKLDKLRQYRNLSLYDVNMEVSQEMCDLAKSVLSELENKIKGSKHSQIKGSACFLVAWFTYWFRSSRSIFLHGDSQCIGHRAFSPCGYSRWQDQRSEPQLQLQSSFPYVFISSVRSQLPSSGLRSCTGRQ